MPRWRDHPLAFLCTNPLAQNEFVKAAAGAKVLADKP